jgi:peptidoglycan/xylan/chitin deacetylase (PgdA/CDA1 family)
MDLRVADLLAARGLLGTFYIPVKGHHGSRLTGLAEMLEVDSRGFEVGAHGVSHPHLTQCDKQQLTLEVDTCKKRLEDDLGKSISMFAYPGGQHNRQVIATLKQAGYVGARTTALLGRGLRFDPFRMPTSAHVFPHTRFDYLRNLAGAADLNRAWVYATEFRHAINWVGLAKSLFDSVLRDGGLWHLWGRSWEIEELRLWAGLREVLDYVAKRPEVSYLSNGAAVRVGANKVAGTAHSPSPSLLESRHQ